MQWKEMLGNVRDDQEKDHPLINFSLYPGWSFQNRMFLLCKKLWMHTPLSQATPREGVCPAETIPKGGWCPVWAHRVHSQGAGRQHGATAPFLGAEREPGVQITETPRTVAANEHCCIKTQLPVFPRAFSIPRGNVQENGLAWKKMKIGCLVLNSNFPKLVG